MLKKALLSDILLLVFLYVGILRFFEEGFEYGFGEVIGDEVGNFPLELGLFVLLVEVLLGVKLLVILIEEERGRPPGGEAL